MLSSHGIALIINRPLTGWKPVPQLAVAEIAREDEETVRGNRDASGVRQTVHAAAIRGHAARIALRVGIEKVVVDVAVEDFLPVATAEKAEPVAVIVERVFMQARDDHDIASDAGQP